jgi:hypothetical protein
MKAALIAIGLSLSVFATAQKSRNWEFSPLGGFLMPHHPDMLYLVDGHVLGGELSVSEQTNGERDWHARYLYPEWGFSFTGYDLGSESMGHALAGRVFFDLPTGKSRIFWLKLSIGAGWIEKPFDLEENNHNSAIGSHLNASLAVEGHFNIPLGGRWLFRPGIGIHHYSNGAMKMPNSGINLAMLRLGFQYRGGPNEIDPSVDPAPVNKTGSLHAGLSGGAKEIQPIGGRTYAILNGFAIWQKRISGKSSLGGEIGINYNESLQYRSSEEEGESLDSKDNYRPYLAVLYQLHFDPLSLRFSLGSYVAARFMNDGAVFFRYHLLYQFKRIQIFAGLKSHYARADNIELGIAYRLK